MINRSNKSETAGLRRVLGVVSSWVVARRLFAPLSTRPGDRQAYIVPGEGQQARESAMSDETFELLFKCGIVAVYGVTLGLLSALLSAI